MLKTKENMRYQVLCHVVLVFLTVFMVFPFVLLFMSSVTEENTLIMNGYSLFPEKFSLEAYRYIFQHGDKVFHAYGVTIFVTVVGTACNLLLTSMLAFGLSLKKLPFRRGLMFYVFFTMLFNGGLVPSYMMYTGTFHIKNTIFAMLVPNLLMSAVNVLLVRTYIETSIPDALYEAAEIDGAGHLTVFGKVALPLGKPILVATGLFAALGYWNDWTNGLYYITNPKLYSIQLLLNEIQQNISMLKTANDTFGTVVMDMDLPSSGVRMAIAVVALLPIMIIFPLIQKQLIKGIVIGAVKG